MYVLASLMAETKFGKFEGFVVGFMLFTALPLVN